MVSVPAGDAVTPLCVAAGCVLEAAVCVSAVACSGRLLPCPEVLPAARAEPGERCRVNWTLHKLGGAFNSVVFIQCVCFN